MPYYSELGIYTSPTSSYTNPYLKGPYASHSSILANNYPPLSHRRGFKPHLTTISETRARSPLRIASSSKPLVYRTSPKIRTNQQKPIKHYNTADIDVSVNKYTKDKKVPGTETALQSPKNEDTSEEPCEVKEAKPNQIIRRERATVRLKTIHKEVLDKEIGQIKSWRDNFKPEELNVEEKVRRKTPGEILKEKFLIRSRSKENIPSTKNLNRKCSVKKNSRRNSSSFHDICESINSTSEDLNPGQPIQIKRRQSRQLSSEDILNELKRTSSCISVEDVQLLDAILNSENSDSDDITCDSVDEDSEVVSEVVSKIVENVCENFDERKNRDNRSSAEAQNKIKRRPTVKKAERNFPKNLCKNSSFKDISQVEIEALPVKPKPLITASVGTIEEKAKLKLQVENVEIVHSPKPKKENKFKFNITIQEIKETPPKMQKQEVKLDVRFPKPKTAVILTKAKKSIPVQFGSIKKQIDSDLKFQSKLSLEDKTAKASLPNIADKKSVPVRFDSTKKQTDSDVKIQCNQSLGDKTAKASSPDIAVRKPKLSKSSSEEKCVPMTPKNTLSTSKSVLNIRKDKKTGNDNQSVENVLSKSFSEPTAINDANNATKLTLTNVNDNVKVNTNHVQREQSHAAVLDGSLKCQPNDDGKLVTSKKVLSDNKGKTPNLKQNKEVFSRKSNISYSSNLNNSKTDPNLTKDQQNSKNKNIMLPLNNNTKDNSEHIKIPEGKSKPLTNSKQNGTKILNSKENVEHVQSSHIEKSKIEVPHNISRTKVNESVSDEQQLETISGNEANENCSGQNCIESKSEVDNKSASDNVDDFWSTIQTDQECLPEVSKIKVQTIEPTSIMAEIQEAKLISKRSLIKKANKDDPDLNEIFDVPSAPTAKEPSPEKDSFVPLQSNRFSQWMHPWQKPKQSDECQLELYARPKLIRYRHIPKRMRKAESDSDDETSSEDEDTSEDETSSGGESDGNSGSTKIGASTSSNDSGFDSARLYGSGNKGGSEGRTSPSSNHARNPAFDIDAEDCGECTQSSTYASFQKTGRITPPATTIPRFKKYSVDDFNFLKVLGKGNFGKVLLAELKGTEYYYAIKCLKKDVVLEDDDVECTLIERKVLALGTKHPYLCHLLCTYQTESHLFFVMEYLNGGDLMFHIQTTRRFSEVRARFYAAEIVSGLKFLHSKGIVYRDLKLDNILLDFDGHVRIADFGMCKLQIFLDRMADTFCGTPDYMAPEIIKGQHYNQCVDWWSFGVLLYEMLIGSSPFSGCDEDELFWSICNEKPVIPKFLSQEASSILVQLMEKDASKRLGNRFSPHGEIQDHVFFRSIDWQALEERRLEPPFKPDLKHPLDTQYFDKTFTKERAKLTPIESGVLVSMDQTQFQGFSYTNPNATDV